MPNKKGAKSPGRPRKFDEADVLNRAASVFLEFGFEAVSYEQIASDTGLSKPSLYNAFGDKLALFERVLEGYSYQAREFILSNIANANSLEEGVQTLLREAATFYSRPNDHSLGCLLIGTSLPATSQHARVRATLTTFISSVETSLEDIVREKFADEIRQWDRTPREIALQIMSLITALAVRARTGLTRRKLTAYSKELASLL